MFSTKFPKSDRGGNWYRLTPRNHVKNLHFAWDSVLYEYTNRIQLPLNKKSWKLLNELADDLMKKYNVSETKVVDLDPINWALESHEIAINFAYQNVQ